MKKLIPILLAILLVCPMAFAQDEHSPSLPKSKAECPKTKIVGDVYDCFRCHIMKLNDGNPVFGLKEIRPDAHMVYPDGVKIINGKGYFMVESIDSNLGDKVMDYFRYLKIHNIKNAEMEIHSGGGSLFEAWRIKGMMDEFKAEGNIIETRLRGIALSAGSLIFLAGTRGHRYANPQSEMMFHELWSFAFFKFESVSDKEDEAKIYRHLQDTLSQWVTTRGRIAKEELDAKIRKKEFWINGQEAFELGFVDKLINSD